MDRKERILNIDISQETQRNAHIVYWDGEYLIAIK